MYYTRNIEEKLKQYHESQEAVIVTGMRRVGKTTLMHKLFEQIPGNKVWFDFENPLDIKIFEDVDYNDIYTRIIAHENLNSKERIYVFIDEVQYFPEISKIVKYLHDHYSVKFFLTGSASYYLRNLFPESLSGRKVIFELYPLDFEEFLRFRGEDIGPWKKIGQQDYISLVDYEKYDTYYEEFIEWGGFPEVVLTADLDKKTNQLEDIFSSYYQKEIIQLADYGKNHKLRDLIQLLATRAGSQLDLVKLSQELGVSRSTIYTYLAFLRDTYMIHLVSRFSKSRDREVSGTQKVYMSDNGLLKVLAQVGEGQIFENAIYNQLTKRGKINYYRTKSGVEIDFILDKNIAFEAKLTSTASDLGRLDRTMKHLSLKEGYVVSKNFVEKVERVRYGMFL